MFGQGGTAVEVLKDNAIALPPLNSVLARDLVSRTRVSKLLAGYRDRAAADIDGDHRAAARGVADGVRPAGARSNSTSIRCWPTTRV